MIGIGKLFKIPFNSSILKARHVFKVLSVQIRGPLQQCHAEFHRNTFFFSSFSLLSAYFPFLFKSCLFREGQW